MRTIVAMARKDLRLLFRDKVGFFFTFFFPLLYAIFFGIIFSGAGETKALKIVVCDEDGTKGSKAFVERLSKAEELDVIVESRERAESLVRRGKRVAFLVLEKGFGDAKISIFGGKPPRVTLGIDPSKRAETGMLQGILMKVAAERLKDSFPSSGGRQSEFKPISVTIAKVTGGQKGPTNAFAVTFPQGIIWGIMGCAAAFGIGMVTERTKGTLVRLSMGPVTPVHILAGKALACFVTTVFVSIVLLLVAVLALGVRPNSYPLLAMAIGCVAFGFVGIMMLLSVLGKTEAAAGGIGWAILTVMAMIGGAMIPLFLMPKWLQTVSHASPVKWSIYAFEGALWRGFSFTEMLLPCGIMLAIGCAFFVLGSIRFRLADPSQS